MKCVESQSILNKPNSKEDIPLITKPHNESYFSCICSIWRRCDPWELCSRTIPVGKPTPAQYPANTIRNQKYNIITFLPFVLYKQFKFLLNLYFLIMATSQFVPDIQIGYLNKKKMKSRSDNF